MSMKFLASKILKEIYGRNHNLSRALFVSKQKSNSDSLYCASIVPFSGVYIWVCTCEFMLGFFLFQAIDFKGEIMLISFTQSIKSTTLDFVTLAMHKVLSYDWILVEDQICYVIMSSVLFQVYEHLCWNRNITSNRIFALENWNDLKVYSFKNWLLHI